MQKVFLSHSSDDKLNYVEIVANKLIKKLGEESVILDKITFQQGRKTIEEISYNLQVTDLFVFFISNKSLDSDWVQNELFEAGKLWNQDKLQQICPIIIDESVSYDDKRIPDWMQDNYNIKYIGRPNKSSKIIEQRMVELTYERHPRIKERNQIFVGRNNLINTFEERMDDFDKSKPVCIVVSGIRSVGRSTLIKKCIFKSNIIKDTYPFSNISLNYDESIEDFILKLYDLGLKFEMDLTDIMHKSVNKKTEIATDNVCLLQNTNDIVLIEDNGCIINHDGVIATWFLKILEDIKIKDKLTLCLISKFRLLSFGEGVKYSVKEKVFSIEVDELNKKERDGLLNRYLKFENIDLELTDIRFISGLLSGYPEQVFYAVSLIKEFGIDYVKKHSDEIVEFNSKKSSIMLQNFENDEDKKSLLALLSSFDYIGLKFIYEIVGDDEKYSKYINEFVSNAICEYVGVAKEYIRVNEVIKDYVVRSNYKIDDQHKKNMQSNLNVFLDNLKMDEYDMPEYLFSLKEALIQNKGFDDRFLIPSLYLKTMNDFYNKRKNKEVVTFADKALEKEEFMDSRIVFEIRYLLCSALAKLKDKRFVDEVHKIEGADFHFLYGFYYRQVGQYDKALDSINISLKKRSNFSKAKREKVQIYLSMQEFQAAKELAKENYMNYKDNPYHIQAYFSCLIKAEKSFDNKTILETLLKALDNIDSDVADEMYLRCKAQYEAFYNGLESTALKDINKAISMNSNLQYARIVKFDICDKFDMLDEMKEILSFFEHPEFKNKYQNNIVCFTAIIKAKEGYVSDAVEYFKEKIKYYTDEAKDKFVVKLNKYCSMA